MENYEVIVKDDKGEVVVTCNFGIVEKSINKFKSTKDIFNDIAYVFFELIKSEYDEIPETNDKFEKMKRRLVIRDVFNESKFKLQSYCDIVNDAHQMSYEREFSFVKGVRE